MFYDPEIVFAEFIMYVYEIYHLISEISIILNNLIEYIYIYILFFIIFAYIFTNVSKACSNPTLWCCTRNNFRMFTYKLNYNEHNLDEGNVCDRKKWSKK